MYKLSICIDGFFINARDIINSYMYSKLYNDIMLHYKVDIKSTDIVYSIVWKNQTSNQIRINHLSVMENFYNE